MNLPHGKTPGAKAASLALAAASAGLSLYTFREASRSLRTTGSTVGAGLVSGTFAGLSAFLVMSAFSGDGLERIIDSQGRSWAIIPPGKSYSDAEGVVFHNRTKGVLPTENKPAQYDEVFFLLESQKGVPVWLWMDQSTAIGRHMRRPFFMRLNDLIVPETSVSPITDLSKLDRPQLQQLLGTKTAVAKWFPSAQLLKPGAEAPEPYDRQQFYYREYDTVS